MSERTFCKLAIGVGVGNYLGFALASLLAGGDVLNGHVLNGHYFVAAAGSFLEVGPALFEFCRIQAYGLVVTIPLLLIGAYRLTPTRRDADDLALSRGE